MAQLKDGTTIGGNTALHTGNFTDSSANWNTAYGWGNHASAGYISTTAANAAYQAAGNYFTDGDTVLNMTNNDGLVYDDATNKMYVKLDGTNREIYHTGNFTDSSANWNTAYGWGDHAAAGYASGSFLGATAKAADSELLDGLDLHTGRNNLANKVVRTQANGYVDFGWINTTSGNTNNTVTDIYVNTNDGYIRKATPAHFRSQITDASYDAAGAADVVNLRIDEEVLPAIPSAIDILTLLSTNNIVDWTTDQGNTNIHSGNYTNSTYSFAGSLFTSRNSGNPLALDSCHSNMVGYTVDSSAAGFADGGLFVAAYSSSWVSQIFSNFRTGEISVRGKNSGTWQDWRFVHDSGHFSVADVNNGVTAHGWGDHGAAGYASEVWVGEQNYASDAAISTAIGTVTLASLGYTGATNANYITNNNQLTNGNGYLTSSNDRNYITDSRGAQRAPSYYNDRYAQWDFQNKADTLAGGDTWHGILTVSKWSVYDPNHRQEQIFFTGDDLKRRTATSDTTWGAVKTIWDSGNFNPADKETAGAAAVVDARIDNEIIPSIPTDNSQLGNGAGYITGVATYNGGAGDGLVPGHNIPAANDQDYFLNGAGNWAIPPDTNTDTNTTYTGGTGMTLNGTVFNCDITSPADVALGNLSSSGNALAGAFTATGDITAFSDARVKENIETIPNALEKVTALRGVNFNKIGEEKRSTGVIAQEVKEVLPEVIHENEDGMLSVAYGNITGVLIEAIKEQQKQIDELKARLDGLTK